MAVGDVTGDGAQDLITAPMVGPANVNVFVNTGITTSPFNAYTTSTPTIKAFSNITGYQGGVGGVTVGNLTNHPATANDPGGVGDIVVGSGVGTPADAKCTTTSQHCLHARRYDHPAVFRDGHRGHQRGRGRRHRRQNPDLVMGAGTSGASQVDV